MDFTDYIECAKLLKESYEFDEKTQTKSKNQYNTKTDDKWQHDLKLESQITNIILYYTPKAMMFLQQAKCMIQKLIAGMEHNW